MARRVSGRRDGVGGRAARSVDDNRCLQWQCVVPTFTAVDGAGLGEGSVELGSALGSAYTLPDK